MRAQGVKQVVSERGTRSAGTQFFRFLMVGGGAFLAYIATQALIIEVAGSGIIIGTVVAFAVGTLVSYVGNTLWSFDSRPTTENLLRFVGVTLFGLALNVTIAAALNEWGVHYVVIAAFIFTVVPVINFVGHRYFSFRTGDAA
jgi:putative flippase GtrA